MKIRDGFVSNSSSSSFVINKKCLTEEQLDAIRNHIEYAKNNFSDFDDIGYVTEGLVWSIKEKESEIYMSTSMDNFDMYTFLLKIGVDESKIESCLR
jgi:hypothetical protein